MDVPKHPEFAAKLKSARLRSGKSQERIAAEVGTSRRHWIRWENGAHLPTPEFLGRIGEAVGQPDEFAIPDDDAEAALFAAAPLSRDEFALYGALTARIVGAQARGVERRTKASA